MWPWVDAPALGWLPLQLPTAPGDCFQEPLNMDLEEMGWQQVPPQLPEHH